MTKKSYSARKKFLTVFFRTGSSQFSVQVADRTARDLVLVMLPDFLIRSSQKRPKSSSAKESTTMTVGKSDDNKNSLLFIRIEFIFK